MGGVQAYALSLQHVISAMAAVERTSEGKELLLSSGQLFLMLPLVLALGAPIHVQAGLASPSDKKQACRTLSVV